MTKRTTGLSLKASASDRNEAQSLYDVGGYTLHEGGKVQRNILNSVTRIIQLASDTE
jgi:hypothetical protein